MSGTYLDFYREVSGTIPRANDFLAQRWVNRGLSSIYRTRFWSFLRGFGYIQVPGQVATGTFTTTLDSAVVTADAAATTALTGLTNPAITSRQIRFAGGPLYNIASFIGSALTLDRIYGEGNATGLSYQVYQAYYGPPYTGTNAAPTTDFVRYLSVLDPIQPQKLMLNKTREWLDLVDQKRTNVGQPSTHLCSFVAETADTAGLPTFEIWPHPLTQRVLICIFARKGLPLVNDTDTIPNIIPESLLLSRALWHGYAWAMANTAKYPELRTNVWPQMRKEALMEYEMELARVQRIDDDVMKQQIASEGQYPTWFSSFATQMNYSGGTPSPPF